MTRKFRFALILGGVLLLLFLVSRPFVIVPAGARAIVFSLTSGVWEKQLDEGFHFLLPLVHRPFVYDVRTQTYSMSRVHWEGEVRGDDSLSVLTADGQTVGVDISVRFRPDPENVWRLHKEVGTDYVNKILRPEIRSQTRVAISEFPVTEVYSAERQVIEDRIESRLRESVGRTYLMIDEVLLRDIQFSAAFAKSIEDKQIAEQNAQRMEYVLERTEKEREQKIIEAEGEAQAIELKGRAVAENATVIQYDYVRKIAPNVGTIISDGSTLAVPLQGTR
jgi:regulator of protease activity HflC (stomatin/prohibitin superfamily)